MHVDVDSFCYYFVDCFISKVGSGRSLSRFILRVTRAGWLYIIHYVLDSHDKLILSQVYYECYLNNLALLFFVTFVIERFGKGWVKFRL